MLDSVIHLSLHKKWRNHWWKTSFSVQCLFWSKYCDPHKKHLVNQTAILQTRNANFKKCIKSKLGIQVKWKISTIICLVEDLKWQGQAIFWPKVGLEMKFWMTVFWKILLNDKFCIKRTPLFQLSGSKR